MQLFLIIIGASVLALALFKGAQFILERFYCGRKEETEPEEDS